MLIPDFFEFRISFLISPWQWNRPSGTLEWKVLVFGFFQKKKKISTTFSKYCLSSLAQVDTEKVTIKILMTSSICCLFLQNTQNLGPRFFHPRPETWHPGDGLTLEANDGNLRLFIFLRQKDFMNLI